MRLLWQSFTAPGSDYHRALADELNSLVRTGTVVDVAGLTPPDSTVHPLSETRCGYQAAIQNLDAAERGYDAVVIGHFQDGGLHHLRAALDIPVVGLGEAAMHQAMMLGEGFGLVTINPGHLWWHRNQVAQYGLGSKFRGARAMRTTPETYFRAFAGDSDTLHDVVRQFTEEARLLVEQGAEVIVPAGGLPALLLWRAAALPDLDGAVVIDPIAIALATAQMWVDLAPTRLAPGRRGPFTRPSAEVLDDFRGLGPAGRQAPTPD